MKGIESVIAVVILIAISIALAGILFTWYRGTLDIEQERTMTAVECSFSSLEISDVFLSGAGGRAVVENTGQMPAEISFIILETQQEIETFSVDITVASRSLASLPFSSNASCADFVSLTVHTTCPGIFARFSGDPVCS